MSRTDILSPSEPGLATVTVPRAALARRARTIFYSGMSVALLLIVLVGFSRTLYMRTMFDVPEVSIDLLIHGFVLTAWFVAMLVQTMLVATYRTDTHRKLGWIGVGLGVAVVIVSFEVTVMFVFRTYAENPNGMSGASRIFWSNMAALLSFAIFLSTAVARRRRPDTHKRLMLLAAIAIVQPAMARIRQVWWPTADGPLFAIVWLSLLVGAIAAHDLYENRRIHPAVLLGGLFFLGSRLFTQYIVAPSNPGMTFIRALVE